MKTPVCVFADLLTPVVGKRFRGRVFSGEVTLSANSVRLDKRIRAVGRVGVEPTTPGLKVR